MEVYGQSPQASTDSEASESGTNSPKTPRDDEVLGGEMVWDQSEVAANMSGQGWNRTEVGASWSTGGCSGLDGFDASNFDFDIDMDAFNTFDLTGFAPPALSFPNIVPSFETPQTNQSQDDVATAALIEMLMQDPSTFGAPSSNPDPVTQKPVDQLQDWCSLFSDST